MIDLFRKCLSLTEGGQRWVLWAIALLTLISSGFEVGGVALVLPFIGMVNDPGVIFAHPMLASLYGALGFTAPSQFVAACGAAFLGVVIAKNVVFFLLARIQGRFAFTQAAKLGTRLVALYLRMPYVQHLRRHSANSITTANHAADQVFIAVLLSFVGAATEALAIGGIILVLVVAEPLVTLASVVFLGAMTAVLFLGMRHHMERFGIADLALQEQRLRVLSQGLDSVKELKVLGREGHFITTYGQVRRENADLRWRNAAILHVPRLTIETLVVIGVVGIVLAALLQGRQTTSITAILGLFAVSAFRIMPALNRILMALNNIKVGASSVARAEADMATLSQLPAEQVSSGAPLTFQRELRLEAVGFTYPACDQPALKQVNLTVRRGESIGFVGGSGAGKSTLVDVILGLLQPDSGRILVDGREIGDNLRTWQDQIGYVPQTIYLADDSVRRNVAYGLPDEAIDDAQVERALAMARLTEVVAALPLGLDTLLGEHGARLSGGQRQRIGLARALYHDPQVLVMDEATSALDNRTEQEVTDAIEGLHGCKTMLVIAHRLSTVMRCDRIAVLRDGEIVDVSTFAQLRDSSTEFQNLLRHGDHSPPIRFNEMNDVQPRGNLP